MHLTASPNIAVTACVFFLTKHQRFVSDVLPKQRSINELHSNIPYHPFFCIYNSVTPRQSSHSQTGKPFRTLVATWGCHHQLASKRLHSLSQRANISAAIEEWHKRSVKAGLAAASAVFFLQVVCHCQSWSCYSLS